MRIGKWWAKVDVYASWFIANFVTGLIPLGLTFVLHNKTLPSSIQRDLTSGYLAYMATLVLVSLNYDVESTGLYRMRRVLGNLFIGIIGLFYVFYNLDSGVHSTVNNYARIIVPAIYCISAVLAFFLNRKLLANSIEDQLAKEGLEDQVPKQAIDKAKETGAAARGMKEELAREDDS